MIAMMVHEKIVKYKELFKIMFLKELPFTLFSGFNFDNEINFWKLRLENANHALLKRMKSIAIYDKKVSSNLIFWYMLKRDFCKLSIHIGYAKQKS